MASSPNYAEKHGRPHGILFTAGPLCTSETVRRAQLDDYGSRDADFLRIVSELRQESLRIAKVSPDTWTCVPMQGCGTMGVEAAIDTITPAPDDASSPGAFVVLCNGSYSHRMAAIVRKRGGATLICFEYDEATPLDTAELEKFLAGISARVIAVGVVHSETSTGTINPIDQVAEIVRRTHPEATLLVDAMSSFGGYDIDVGKVADILVTSANKCIQGVPGLSLILTRTALLNACRGNARSFAMDVVKVWDGLEKNGQFLFTPPVQALVACRQAMRELEAEGGVLVRAARYRALNTYITDQMLACGFTMFLDRSKPYYGYIITAFNMPTNACAGWDFQVFYNKLKERGFVIYPGKASRAETFRIGTFGDITMADCEALIAAVREVLADMNVKL